MFCAKHGASPSGRKPLWAQVPLGASPSGRKSLAIAAFGTGEASEARAARALRARTMASHDGAEQQRSENVRRFARDCAKIKSTERPEI